MLAKHADPDNQDINGNSVLHMLVIHEKLGTFDMAYETGSDLYLKNLLNLTPLTLAAKLARVEMFFHILNIDREIYWQLGSITCAAYPLDQIDTIDRYTGNINKDSALNLVTFGVRFIGILSFIFNHVSLQDKDEHLDLLEGVLIDLLKTKWNTFVKAKFYRQFYFFFMYFLVSLFAFGLRPKAFGSRKDEDDEEHRNSTRNNANFTDATASAPVKSQILHNLTDFYCNYTIYAEALIQKNLTSMENSTMPTDDDSNEWKSFSECPLLDISTIERRVR